MNRKWTVLSLTVAATALLAAGFAIAAEEEETPIQKLMEKVGAKQGSINKAIKTPVAFKKAGGKAVSDDAAAMVKLYKEAREMKEPAEKLKKPADLWQKYMDAAIKDAEEFAKVAEKDEQPAVKKAYDKVKMNCANCHNDFKVDKE